MAERTKTWSVSTSPRSPYKLPTELRLLLPFVGQRWTRETQRAFAECLKQSDDFEGYVYETQPDWSARDRINRAPLTFGLVSLQPTISITAAGHRLLAEDRVEDLMLRQLLKWQYPSPKHGDRYYRKRFCIRPFLETLRLAKDCEGLTKDEIALFAVPLIRYSDYSKTRAGLMAYRQRVHSLSAGTRARFRRTFILETFRHIYREDIKLQRIHTRQSATKTAEQFLVKKYRNARDYADAATRYFRATSLFSLSSRTSRLIVRPHRLAFVEELLGTFPRRPDNYQRDPAGFLQKLRDPTYPPLPSDKPEILKVESEILGETLKRLGARDRELEAIKAAHAGAELRDVLEQEVKRRNSEAIRASLRTGRFREEILTSLMGAGRARMLDGPIEKSLMLEWDLWRAFETINQGDIRPNMLLDEECQPLDHAPGRCADLEAFYDRFVLVVEATLTVGERQYDAEAEPVARHYGAMVRRLQDQGDQRPVYGVFIAPKISAATVAHFYTLRKERIDHYGGKARFVPLSIAEFGQLLSAAGQPGRVSADCVLEALRAIDLAAEQAHGEQEWIQRVRETLEKLKASP